MLRDPSPALSDGVITLRAKRPEDIEAITDACQDAAIQRWTGVPSPYGRKDAEEWLDESARLADEGRGVDFLVVDADDTLLGSVGFPELDLVRGTGEIGYWIAEQARGQGIAARAVVLLREWAERELRLLRIEILVDRENLASRRVAVRAGFADSGERRVRPRTEGATELDHVVYVWRAPSAA